MGIVAWLRGKLTAAQERKPSVHARAQATACLDHAARHAWDCDQYPQQCARCGEVRTFETEDQRCPRSSP